MSRLSCSIKDAKCSVSVHPVKLIGREQLVTCYTKKSCSRVLLSLCNLNFKTFMDGSTSFPTLPILRSIWRLFFWKLKEFQSSAPQNLRTQANNCKICSHNAIFEVCLHEYLNVHYLLFLLQLTVIVT